jgi:uncharacterized membrane protein
MEELKKDSIIAGFEHIVIILFCIFYLYHQLNNLEESVQKPIIYRSDFWFAAGILIYMSATFFLIILSNSLTKEERIKYFVIYYFSSAIKNIFFAVAIYVAAKSRTGKTLAKPNL